MASEDPIYPAKRTTLPNEELTFPQFFLPIRINGEEMWALLDTGANVSILPLEIANQVISPADSRVDDGTYPMASIIGVPYVSYELNFEVFEYINNTIPELNLIPYTTEGTVAVELRNVEFHVPQLTWPEIANRLEAEEPLSVHGDELTFAILGLYGVLDQLTLSFVGDNSVQISPVGPR